MRRLSLQCMSIVLYIRHLTRGSKPNLQPIYGHAQRAALTTVKGTTRVSICFRYPFRVATQETRLAWYFLASRSGRIGIGPHAANGDRSRHRVCHSVRRVPRARMVASARAPDALAAPWVF